MSVLAVYGYVTIYVKFSSTKNKHYLTFTVDQEFGSDLAV